MTTASSTCADAFLVFRRAMQRAEPIQRISKFDKEVHFRIGSPSGWDSVGLQHDSIGRGDFLNADHNYVHKNKSFRGSGSYGDVLVRDRKMYVASTSFALTSGTTDQATLITPDGLILDGRLEQVGELVRIETGILVVGYTFDLWVNKLTPELAPNPSAGEQHRFAAYRLKGMGSGTVSTKNVEQVKEQPLGDDE